MGVFVFMDLAKIIKQDGYYRFKVIPNQPKIEIKDQLDDGTIKIALTQAPEKNQANKELIEFLSNELRISKESVKIISGLTSRIKVLSIEMEN